MRRRATLDALVRPHVNRPFHEVQDPLVDLLRVGAYQLAFLTHVPRHAAVHETVEATLPMARGFVNAVLRRVSEAVTDEFVFAPAADAVPLDGDQRHRKLAKPLLPDPATHPAPYLAAAFGWPRWLADRWLDRHGFMECVRLGFWFNAPPPLWLRVNATQLPREAYRLALAAAGIAADSGGHPQALTLPDPPPVRQLPGYDAGEFAVQDLASMAVASAVAPQPGWRVLDLCSAPGGKTTHLAELMADRGEVVACDVDPRRLATVTALYQRLKLTCVTPHLLDKRDTVPPPGPYDAALVDAPCSNTGVLGRRPEARWRLHPSEFGDLIRLQTRLLHQPRCRRCGRAGWWCTAPAASSRTRTGGWFRRFGRRSATCGWRPTTPASPAGRPTAGTGRGCGNRADAGRAGWGRIGTTTGGEP